MIENIIVTCSIIAISACIGFIVGYKQLDVKFFEYWENRKWKHYLDFGNIDGIV